MVKLTLENICECIVDCEHKTAPTQETGYPSIRTPNIGKGFFLLDNVRRVSEDTYKKWTKRAIPQADDLILAREAPVGNVAIIPRNLKVCLGQRTVLIRPNKNKIDPRYLCYLLLGHEIQGKFSGLSNGATVHHLNVQDIRNLELPQLPPLPIQRAIASILSNYDDLIENNNRRIKILEEMAKTVYQEWFVKFRFPNHENVKMVESELGLIPEGWHVKNLFDVVDVTYGYPFKSKQFTEETIGMGTIRIRDIKNNQIKTYTTETVNDKYIVKTGDILIGMDGDFHMGIWANENAYLVQRVARLRPSKNISKYYIFHAIKQPIEHFNSTITGTTVAHLGDKHLRTINILIPTKEILQQLTKILEPILEWEINLKLKNINLRKTRDLLLPKLISGEIDVENLNINTDRLAS